MRYHGWEPGVRIHESALIGGPPNMYGWQDGDEIHPVRLGEDVQIGAYCAIDGGYDSATVIGARTIIMQLSHVAHDCKLGTDVTLAVGTILGGYVTIGDGSKLGLNSTVLPYRKIGSGCTIGAGAVVTSNVPDGETWAGNPARPVTGRDPRPFSEREHDEIFERVRCE